MFIAIELRAWPDLKDELGDLLLQVLFYAQMASEAGYFTIEDVAAKPYQIDRMLRQMLLAGKFDGVTGLIFGEMLECVSPGATPELLDEVILRVFDWFEGPIATGLRSGHVSRGNVTLPLGIEAELILEDEPVLRYLEPAVLV